MPQPPTRSRVRLVASAGLLASAAAVVAVTGAGPVPSLFQLSSATHGTSDVNSSGSADASSTSEATTLDTTTGVDDRGTDTAIENDSSDVTVSATTDSTIDDDQGEIDDDQGEIDDDQGEIDDDQGEIDDDHGTEIDDDHGTDTTVDDHGTDTTDDASSSSD